MINVPCAYPYNGGAIIEHMITLDVGQATAMYWFFVGFCILASRQKFLYLHTRNKKYEIVASFFPNKQIYEEVKSFLFSQMRQRM